MGFLLNLMSKITIPRINLSFVDVASLEDSLSVYSKPMPVMARRTNDFVLVYPLMSKSDWIQQSLVSNTIVINNTWKQRTPLKASVEQFDEKFILLKGSKGDSLAIYGLKPQEIKAVRVDVPACVIRDGQKLPLEINDYLLAMRDGSNISLPESVMERLFAKEYDLSSFSNFEIKTKQVLDNDFDLSM